MADDKATSAFMDLPLEVRHTIFEHTTARDVKPKKLLRYWFEKQEVKETVAKHAADNPGGPAPQIVHYNNDYDDDSSLDEEAGEQYPDSEGEEEDEDDEANEDQGGENEEEENMDQDGDEDDVEVDSQEEVQAEAEDQDDQGTGSTQAPTSAQVQPEASTTNEDDDQAETSMELNTMEDLAEVEEGETVAQDEQNAGGEDGDEVMAEEGDEGDSEEDDNEDDMANAPPPPAPAPVFSAHRKWRYIPKFMRLSRCPPPVELLLTCKQLNTETKNWFYDVAVLHIKATASFAHTSFFEEAFTQITEAAFSPMENIRKVEVTFVWDTTWVRADTTGFVDAIFPALLRQRSNFVYQILRQAPDLREVVIHWHDSAQDNDSAALRIDVLEPFDNLSATVKIVEHYIPADSKPLARSIAGKQRLEFESILEMGLDRLY